jgi:predicted nucleic acid-binding Zn ribbon protein
MVDIHKHCPICGTPIPLKETVCSDKCRQVLIERQKKIRKTRIIYYGVLIVFIIAFYFAFIYQK